MTFNEATKRSLTAESKDAASGNIVSRICDLDGNPLGPNDSPVTIVDAVDGTTWARLTAQKPTQKDPLSVQELKLIEDKSPVFVDSTDTNIRGWFVPSPDYGYKAPKASK